MAGAQRFSIALCLLVGGASASDQLDDAARRGVHEREQARVDLIARIRPACVSVFDTGQSGGGSGVIIDERGYGLTNFHVVAPMMNTRKGWGGLDDGGLYELEVLGIDITGDVAMFRLTGRDRFDFVALGDSDAVRVGDDVIAIGNPFVLAEDYTPTVTTGIVTGIHRYQGEGATLVYTDCIQTDAAINPGNSGGPLFDAVGRVIGINGRISAAMHRFARGRFNVGLGYAISINQIKRFIPHLRAGLLGRHGTLLATVTDDLDRVVFDNMFEDGPAWDAGVRVGNRLLRFGNRDIRSANHFASVLGTYPEHWPVPITFESRRGVVHKVVRLESVVPSMRAPFVPTESVNRLAMQEALDAFRTAALGDASSKRPRRWSATSSRTGADGKTITVRYEDEQLRGVEIVERDESGDVVRRLELDGEALFLIEGGKRYPIGGEESLLHRALGALRWDLLSTAPESAGAAHLGGDALIDVDDAGRITRSRMLETVKWPLDEHVMMNVGFDLATHLPARLVVRDAPSDVMVEVVFDDPLRADGVTWPHSMSVKGSALGFDERITELSVER